MIYQSVNFIEQLWGWLTATEKREAAWCASSVVLALLGGLVGGWLGWGIAAPATPGLVWAFMLTKERWA